jgi:RNA polymerase sigma-70 factor (ECF subfamily)
MEAIKLRDFESHKISEHDIIKRILGGENELFEILLRRNNQKLYRIIRGYIGNTADVEDVIQNTHMKAFEKLYQFKLSSSYSTWLIRIGINEALARIREKKKIINISAQPNEFESNSILEKSDNSQITPENNIIQKETKLLFELSIDNLDSKYKAVYILKEMEGMSVKEVSETLDISESNVKVRLHRAKKILKDELYDKVTTDGVFEFGFSRCDRITEFVMGLIV